MSRYYFFAATLPSLQFGAPPPMPPADFLVLAARYLDGSDLGFLSSLGLGEDEELRDGPRIAARHRAWDREVRNELVRLRARRLGREPGTWLRGGGEASPAAAKAAQAAFQAPSPLDGELVLEGERWSLLDALSPFQSFDLESICAYYLKLLILERLASFGAEGGEAMYRETYAAILGSARTSRDIGVQ